jgi:hypothetical protein
LARSTPIVVIVIADGSFCSWSLMETTLWHLDAGSGSHPHHLLWVVAAVISRPFTQIPIISAFGGKADIFQGPFFDHAVGPNVGLFKK